MRSALRSGDHGSRGAVTSKMASMFWGMLPAVLNVATDGPEPVHCGSPARLTFQPTKTSEPPALGEGKASPDRLIDVARTTDNQVDLSGVRSSPGRSFLI